MFKLCFYVPASHLESVKNALFAAKAGRIGHYDCCSWQTLGTGQYRPLSGSTPYHGQHHEITTEEEYLVEMVCEDSLIDEIVATLKKVHPYETPAFSAWKLYDFT